MIIMESIEKLTREKINKLKLVCFDVDGVTVKKGTNIKEIEGKESTTLTVKTANLSDIMLNKVIELKKYYYICIASGRSLLYLTKIYYDLLWEKSALIAENGIFTLLEGKVIQQEKFDNQTLKTMRDMFVELKAMGRKNKNFRAFEPKQFLITVHAWKEIPDVYKIVRKYDPEDEFYCLWNGEAYDIAPKRLNKGVGLQKLAQYLGWKLDNTLAIGNGPNDRTMVSMAGIGVTTDPTDLKTGDYFTTDSLHLGGLQVINKLLNLNK